MDGLSVTNTKSAIKTNQPKKSDLKPTVTEGFNLYSGEKVKHYAETSELNTRLLPWVNKAIQLDAKPSDYPNAKTSQSATLNAHKLAKLITNYNNNPNQFNPLAKAVSNALVKAGKENSLYESKSVWTARSKTDLLVPLDETHQMLIHSEDAPRLKGTREGVTVGFVEGIGKQAKLKAETGFYLENGSKFRKINYSKWQQGHDRMFETFGMNTGFYGNKFISEDFTKPQANQKQATLF
jgi:hypothetical protein